MEQIETKRLEIPDDDPVEDLKKAGEIWRERLAEVRKAMETIPEVKDVKTVDDFRKNEKPVWLFISDIGYLSLGSEYANDPNAKKAFTPEQIKEMRYAGRELKKLREEYEKQWVLKLIELLPATQKDNAVQVAAFKSALTFKGTVSESGIKRKLAMLTTEDLRDHADTIDALFEKASLLMMATGKIEQYADRRLGEINEKDKRMSREIRDKETPLQQMRIKQMSTRKRDVFDEIYKRERRERSPKSP